MGFACLPSPGIGVWIIDVTFYSTCISLSVFHFWRNLMWNWIWLSFDAAIYSMRRTCPVGRTCATLHWIRDNRREIGIHPKRASKLISTEIWQIPSPPSAAISHISLWSSQPDFHRFSICFVQTDVDKLAVNAITNMNRTARHWTYVQRSHECWQDDECGKKVKSRNKYYDNVRQPKK